MMPESLALPFERFLTVSKQPARRLESRKRECRGECARTDTKRLRMLSALLLRTSAQAVQSTR
jgi:hypothetical protein